MNKIEANVVTSASIIKIIKNKFTIVKPFNLFRPEKITIKPKNSSITVSSCFSNWARKMPKNTRIMPKKIGIAK